MRFNREVIIALFAVTFCSSPQQVNAQSSEELTSYEIFDELVNYYDPDSLWADFSGKMQMTSLRNGKLTTQEISLNNRTDIYTCIRNREDGIYIKGTDNGESFFEINGEKMTAEQVPEEYQKYPYSLSEHYAQTYLEHHTFHFSLPLALKAAGARPLEGVGKKQVFGKQCVSITFEGYPDNFEEGYYNGEITLYVIPESGYRLHAIRIDNGNGPAKEGMFILLDGEIEVGGIKVPASKITFFDNGSVFLMTDAFQNITDGEEE